MIGKFPIDSTGNQKTPPREGVALYERQQINNKLDLKSRKLFKLSKA
jgi:hypothetical protein